MSTNSIYERALHLLVHEQNKALFSLHQYLVAIKEQIEKGETEEGLSLLEDCDRHIEITSRAISSIVALAEANELVRLQCNYVSVQMVVSEAIQLHKVALNGYKYSVAIADGLIIYGHKPLLIQAIGALIDNTIKYRDNNRPLTMAIRGYQVDKQAIIEVQDNGRGFPESYTNRLFEWGSQSRLNSTIPGSGIGLALVKAVVNAHRGSVVAKGQLNSGALFTLYLPTKCDEYIIG